MQFEWDTTKADSNLAKHGAAFDVVERFDFQSAHVVVDDRFAYGETRMQALGLIDGRVHVLVFAPGQGVLRVISLRKANQREVRIYNAS